MEDLGSTDTSESRETRSPQVADQLLVALAHVAFAERDAAHHCQRDDRPPAPIVGPRQVKRPLAGQGAARSTL